MDKSAMLKPKLVRLKLSGILETLDDRLKEATEGKWDYTQFLLTLLSDEVERRDNKQLSRRLGKSGIDPAKSLKVFDFSFNPRIHEPTVKQIAGCSFIEERNNIFLVGPSGVGKSHLAQAIGIQACLEGVDVLYRNTGELLKWIHAGRADGNHERRLIQTVNAPLLILDDFGLQPLTEYNQLDLFELISRRYERSPMIITSNRDFAEWPMIFDNPLMGSAAMDRLVHRAVKLVIEGESYRMNNFLKLNEDLTKGGRKSTTK
jgi:DNA replication protein DnaC